MSVVDVIIPYYNRNELLKRAIRSVKAQSYPYWNLILLDDGSTQIFSHKSYGDKIKHYRWENNKGVSYARNQGLKISQAPWVAFLDSDDEWLPQKLEQQIQYAKQNPQYPLIHCNEIWMKNGQLLNQKKHHKKTGGRVFIPSLRLCCISPSAVLVKKELFDELGLFNEDFPVCEDYELWLRVSSRYEVGFLNQALLIKHGGHKDQLSKKYVAMDYWRVKAMLYYLKADYLSLKEQQVLKQEILKKSTILIKGYKKHNNYKKQKELEKIYQQALNSD